MIGDVGRQGVDQAQAPVGACQQQHASVRADPAGIERGGDCLLADTWQGEREKAILAVCGHVGACPDGESGFDTGFLRDSRRLYHARQRIPAMR